MCGYGCMGYDDQMVVEMPRRFMAVVCSAALVSACDSKRDFSSLSLPAPPTSYSMAVITSVPITSNEDLYLADILSANSRSFEIASFLDQGLPSLMASLAQMKSRISVAWLMGLYSGTILGISSCASFILPCLQKISSFFARMRLDQLEAISCRASFHCLLSMQLFTIFSSYIYVAGGLLLLAWVGALLCEIIEREKCSDSFCSLMMRKRQDCDLRQCCETASQISYTRIAPASCPLILSTLLVWQMAERWPYSRSISVLLKIVTTLKVLRMLNTTSPSSLVDWSGLMQQPQSLSGSSLSWLGKLTVNSTAVFQFLYYSFAFFNCLRARQSSVKPRMKIGKAKPQFLSFMLFIRLISSSSSTATMKIGAGFFDLTLRQALEMPLNMAAMGNAIWAMSFGSFDLSRIWLRFSMMNLSWNMWLTATIHFFSSLVSFSNYLLNSCSFFCSSSPGWVLLTSLQKFASYSSLSSRLTGGFCGAYLLMQKVKMRKKRTQLLGSISAPIGMSSGLLLPVSGMQDEPSPFFDMLSISSTVDMYSVLLSSRGTAAQPPLGNYDLATLLSEQQFPPMLITNTCKSKQAPFQFTYHNHLLPANGYFAHRQA